MITELLEHCTHEFAEVPTTLLTPIQKTDEERLAAFWQMHKHCVRFLHETFKECNLHITNADTKIKLKDEVHDHSKSHPIDTMAEATLHHGMASALDCHVLR